MKTTARNQFAGTVKSVEVGPVSAQVTIALKLLPWGKHVAVLTDARFSGVSTGACIGHIGPEALAGGPIGKVRDGDWGFVQPHRSRLNGVQLVGRLRHLPGQRRSTAADRDCGQPHV